MQKAGNIGTYAADAQHMADVIGTSLWGTGLTNADLDESSFELSSDDFARLNSLSGAKHVDGFAYDEDNKSQYTVTPKIETVSSGSIVTGFAVKVRVYYAEQENGYEERSFLPMSEGGTSMSGSFRFKKG